MTSKLKKPIRTLFIQPVLAPYSIPRYKALAESGNLEIHVALEAESFDERPGWIPKPILGCFIHVMSGIKKTKYIHSSTVGFTEKYTKVIPYGMLLTLWKVKPDVVIVCNPTQFLFALFSFRRKKFQLGVILEDTLVSEKRKHKLIQLFRKYLYQKADFVFYYSDDAKVYAESINLKSTLFRTSWTVNEEWLQQTIKLREAKMLAISKKTKRVLQYVCVGSLSERKGVLLLLRAWIDFSKCKQDTRLVYVGQGPLLGDIERICHEQGIDNVEVLGHLPYEKTQEVYLASDIFVFPTLEDVYGLVVTEALSFGLPILTTEYCGARELVAENENGYIFDPLNHKDFVQTLEKSYQRRATLGDMGESSLKKISTRTHKKIMNKMEKDIISLYQ